MDDGTIGYGEGVARPYVTGENVDSSLNHIQQTIWPSIAQSVFSEITPGPDPVDSLSQVYRAIPDNVTDGVVAFHAARAAVEIAIVDGILKRQQMSLAQILPPKRTEVVYSGVITAGSIAKAEQHARHFKLFGIKQLKVKIGGADSVTRVEAVRQIVGPDASLRVDANGDYSVASSIAMLADLAPFNIVSVEQPIPRGEPIDLARVRQCSTIPIMADESLVTLDDARALIAVNACDYFNLRLSKCGGIVRTLEMARLVSGLERLLELAKAQAVEPEGIRRLVEARTLFERDDAVLDDLREDLLVVNFEFAELEVAGELALLERSFVLERELFGRHALSPKRRRAATFEARSYPRRG